MTLLATDRTSLGLRVPGALLALAVTVIHLIDQGGITTLKDPAYVGYGYWLLELAGIACAAMLLAGIPGGWLLAAGAAAGPLIGFILSRGPGLPNYSDDKGNWTEPLGVLAMVVEVVLLLLALSSLARARRTAY